MVCSKTTLWLKMAQDLTNFYSLKGKDMSSTDQVTNLFSTLSHVHFSKQTKSVLIFFPSGKEYVENQHKALLYGNDKTGH